MHAAGYFWPAVLRAAVGYGSGSGGSGVFLRLAIRTWQ
jgi:hypothetical protein